MIKNNGRISRTRMGLREAESRADDQRDQTPELMSPRNGRCHGLNILGDRKM